MTSNSIAVLGYRSWVGHKVVPALAAAGCRLRLVARPGSGTASADGSTPGAEVVEVDWEDADAMVEAVKGFDIVLYVFSPHI